MPGRALLLAHRATGTKVSSKSSAVIGRKAEGSTAGWGMLILQVDEDVLARSLVTSRIDMGLTQVRYALIISECTLLMSKTANLTITETIVTPFTSDYLSAYLSVCPSPSDAVLSFGPMDVLMTPAPHYLPTRLFHLFPHPAQDSSEKRRYVAILSSR